MDIQQLSEMTPTMMEALKPFDVICDHALVMQKNDMGKNRWVFEFALEQTAPRVLKWDYFAYETTFLSQKGKLGLVYGCSIQGVFRGLMALEVVLWKKSLHITHLFVQESARRMGIGSGLIAFAMDFARDKQLSYITVEVQSGNGDAIQYYQMIGFEIIGFECDRYRGILGFEEDVALFMRKRLE